MSDEVDISDLIPVSDQHSAFRMTSADHRAKPDELKYVDNKQAWKNNPELQAIQPEVKDDFFNVKQPTMILQSENPTHRLMCYLKAQGLSNREIALRTDKSEPWVSQVLRQPWARKRIAEEMQASGRDAIETVITAAAEDSVYKLIELRDEAKQQNVQLAAANALLDRFLGKPTQKVESEVKTTIQSTDVAELQNELAAAEAELKRRGLGVGSTN